MVSAGAASVRCNARFAQQPAITVPRELAFGETVNKASVTVTFSCTDTGSGVASVSPAVTISADGAAQAATGTCTDKVGNSATTSLSVNVDKTAPTGMSLVNADGTPYTSGTWTHQSVGVTCSDATSGIDASAYSPALTSQGANQSYTGTCADRAGNSMTRTFTGINIDKTSPTVSFQQPIDGAVYPLHQSPISASYTCSDSLSGMAGCVGDVRLGGAIDTTSVGAKTFTVTATDVAGNVTRSSVTYVVKYQICVLFTQTAVWDKSTDVPIKIQLCDVANVAQTSGAAIQADAPVQISTTATGTLQAGPTTTPDGGFVYDAASASYHYNLRMPATAADGTYRLYFRTAADGSGVKYSVDFRIRAK